MREKRGFRIRQLISGRESIIDKGISSKLKSEIELEKHNNYEHGITLIALVVTIIVLLILASVTISAVFSNNGIIKKAQEAKNTWESAIENEQQEIQKLVNELNNVTKEEEIQDYEISEISDVTYNGQEQKPYPLLIDEEGNLLSKEDYTVEYRNNINAGTAEVIIKIKSTGQVIVKEFTIKKRDVKIYIQNYSCTGQDPIPEFSYTTEGLINPDDLKLVRFLLDGEEVPPVANMPVGAYTISIEFEPNENYNLIIYPGVLNVNASPVPGNSTTPTPVNGDRDF